MRSSGLLILFLLVLASGCKKSTHEKSINIAFSQATLADSWHNEMLNDMYRQINLEEKKIHFVVRNANGDSKKQMKDIQGLLKLKPDVLIVNPLEREESRDFLDSIYQSGMPLILFNTVANQNKFSATIGVAYFRLGQKIADYINENLKQKGEVLYVENMLRSHKVIALKGGYKSRIKGNLISTNFVECEGTQEGAMNVVLSDPKRLDNIDFILAYSDDMARGAYMACKQLGVKKDIIGLNGLMGQYQGLNMVKKKQFFATYRIPTGGKEAIKIASKLLNKGKVKKYNNLITTRVDSSNVDEVMFEAHVLDEQAEIIDQQIEKLDEMNSRVEHQQRWTRTLILGSLILFSILLFTLTIYIRRTRVQKKLLKKHREEFEDFKNDKKSDIKKFLVPDITKTTNLNAEFFSEVSDWLNKNITNNNLKVEEVASEFNMSQSSFYRRIKEISGMSVVALILQMRLEHAAKLLLVTNDTIEQIAYESGFNDAGYFSKCFRKTYGQSPNAFRTEMRESVDA